MNLIKFSGPIRMCLRTSFSATALRLQGRFNIHRVWREKELPGEPSALCENPWRPGRGLTFFVSDDGWRWRDFETGECGDAHSFRMRIGVERLRERWGSSICTGTELLRLHRTRKGVR